MTPLIREATREDLVYVLPSWTKMSHTTHKSEFNHLSLDARSAEMVLPAKRGTYRSPLSYSLYDKLFRAVQTRILARATCIVAVNPRDENQILGYLIYGPSICYFLQIKKDFWGRGFARALLEHAHLSKDDPIVYAFPTPLASVPRAWVFVPWYLHAEILHA